MRFAMDNNSKMNTRILQNRYLQIRDITYIRRVILGLSFTPKDLTEGFYTDPAKHYIDLTSPLVYSCQFQYIPNISNDFYAIFF